MLKPKMKAPDFALLDQDGKKHRLSDYRGRIVVLYFYPKDFTPGCTMEGNSFRENFAAFTEKNASILGVSADSQASHKRFKTGLGLPYDLLSDPKMEIVEKYGALKKVNGKRAVHRCTFIIDGNGKIRKIFRDVDPFTHVSDVLEALGK